MPVPDEDFIPADAATGSEEDLDDEGFCGHCGEPDGECVCLDDDEMCEGCGEYLDDCICGMEDDMEYGDGDAGMGEDESYFYTPED